MTGSPGDARRSGSRNTQGTDSPLAGTSEIWVIATRDPGEYVLKIGDRLYLELHGRREPKSDPWIARLLTVPYWGWDWRKPDTPYPCTTWGSDYEMVYLDEEEVDDA